MVNNNKINAMKVKINVIKFETINGKKVGKAFSFFVDAKQMARMTHLEKFTYPVWNTSYEEIIEPLLEERYVLFDYKERNPLTYEAKYTGNIAIT